MRVDADFLEKMAEKRALRLSRMLHIEIKTLYPKRAKTLGEKNLREFSERCALDTYHLGCKNYGELKAYAFIAMHLGIGFTADPQYPWVRGILSRKESFNLKVESLSKVFFESYYNGTETSLTAHSQALKKLSQVQVSDVEKLRKYSEITKVLEEIYPERVAQLGGVEKLSKALAQASHEKIKTYGLAHPTGVFIVSTLVFFLGADVDNDPFYPWVAKYLKSEEDSMAIKIEQLLKVIHKRIKANIRNIDKILGEQVA